MAPNILILCTDQQRWDSLGATGNPHVSTPAIDGLYKTGAGIPLAYCQSPVCSPSRASFTTGRYPRTTRVRQNGQDIPADERLLGRILADHGYACGLAGKLHLSACHPSAAPVMERRIDDGFHVFHWSHHPGASVSDQARGTVGDRTVNWALNDYNAWLAARGRHYDTAPLPETDLVVTGPAAEDHQTAWCAERAIQFIDRFEGVDSPWMFTVNFFDPHHPFDPPADYLQRHLDKLDDLPLPAKRDGELDDKPPYQATDAKGAYGGLMPYDPSAMSETEHRIVRAAFHAMIDLIDDQVARILDALDRTGQREDTLVVFMSDHGELLGDHGLYLKGPFFYEPSVRVPLVLNWPGTIAPQTVEGLVELVDLVPTLLDAAGLPPEPGVQGKSLWSSIAKGQGRSDRESVYCEYYNAMNWHDSPGPAFMTMIRDERWKLVADHGNGGGELYDLDADPGEHVNLWNHPDHREERFRMLEQLAARMAFTVDPLPARRAIW